MSQLLKYFSYYSSRLFIPVIRNSLLAGLSLRLVNLISMLNIKDKNINILDFGGGAGHHYYLVQNLINSKFDLKENVNYLTNFEVSGKF